MKIREIRTKKIGEKFGEIVIEENMITEMSGEITIEKVTKEIMVAEMIEEEGIMARELLTPGTGLL